MKLRKAHADELAAAKAIVEAAKSESRDLTTDEQATVQGHITQAKQLKGEIESAQKSSSLISELGTLDIDEEHPAPAGKSLSLGQHFVKSVGGRLPEIKGQSGASISAPEFKAYNTTVVTGGAGGDLGPLLADVDRELVTGPRPAAVVADLFGQGTISGSAITYFVEAAREGDFEGVAEAGPKPQMSYVEPVPVTESLKKIAGFIKLSDEMMEDLPFLVSEIDTRLIYDLQKTEESQILSGGGSAALEGVLTRSIGEEESEDAEDDADAVYRGITKVDTDSGFKADGLVINPLDYQKFRLAKDSNKQYYGGGYFTGAYGVGGVPVNPPLWGVRTVVTSAIEAGTVLVGAFNQGGTVYRKGGLRVESTNSHASDFTSNLVTIRAEERIALAIRRPSAFVAVTLADES